MLLPKREEPMSIVVTRDGPATVVSIDRPERRNAVDSATALALHRAFAEFEADADASVAVLTGEGGCFCAGADLKAMAEGDRRRMAVDGPTAVLGRPPSSFFPVRGSGGTNPPPGRKRLVTCVATKGRFYNN